MISKHECRKSNICEIGFGTFFGGVAVASVTFLLNQIFIQEITVRLEKEVAEVEEKANHTAIQVKYIAGISGVNISQIDKAINKGIPEAVFKAEYESLNHDPVQLNNYLDNYQHEQSN